MRGFVADDFDAIRARMLELKASPPSADIICGRCEDGGYIMVHSGRPPCFQTCPDCGNPNNHPSP